MLTMVSDPRDAPRPVRGAAAEHPWGWPPVDLAMLGMRMLEPVRQGVARVDGTTRDEALSGITRAVLVMDRGLGGVATSE